jgi:hypothetical protein
MKKIILFALLFSLFLGCEKVDIIDIPKEEEPSTPVDPTPKDEPSTSVDDLRKQMEEDIYKETGCRTTDADKIIMYKLFETEKDKYLYGSKEINDKESLWVSKYNQQGDCIWEKILSDLNYKSHAVFPFVLSNDNIVFSYVRKYNNSFEVITGTPIIVDVNSGEIIQVKTKEIYFFDQVHAFSDFFFCTLSDKEKLSLSVEGDFSIQVSNNGDVINEKNIINIPTGYTIWKDNENFVSIGNGKISRGTIFKTEDPSLWNFYPDTPSGEPVSISAYFDEDTVVVQFKYGISNEEKEYEYKLSYIDGKQLTDDAGSTPAEIIFSDFNKEYLAKNGMTVIVHNIEVNSNNSGTLYYTINYTQYNKTKDAIITEGLFAAYYNNIDTPGELQYGFFSDIYPGEHINRSYTFKSLEMNKYLFIHYNADLFHNGLSAVTDDLNWEIPY